MVQASQSVLKFFEAYETAIRSQDLSIIETLYGETFLFGGPQGTQAVKRDDFLKVLPRRSGFFKAIGLSATTLQSIDETRLDERYLLVKVIWLMHFEKDGNPPIIDPSAASYILVRDGDALRIVFQLDHQDLAQRAQELGLLPAKS